MNKNLEKQTIRS